MIFFLVALWLFPSLSSVSLLNGIPLLSTKVLSGQYIKKSLTDQEILCSHKIDTIVNKLNDLERSICISTKKRISQNALPFEKMTYLALLLDIHAYALFKNNPLVLKEEYSYYLHHAGLCLTEQFPPEIKEKTHGEQKGTYFSCIDDCENFYQSFLTIINDKKFIHKQYPQKINSQINASLFKCMEFILNSSLYALDLLSEAHKGLFKLNKEIIPLRKKFK